VSGEGGRHVVRFHGAIIRAGVQGERSRQVT
jgi:hypothetical protein